MTQFTDEVNQARFRLYKERTNLPTLELRAEWDYMLKRYPNGKLVKVFYDKRKKDEVVSHGEEY